MSALLQKADIAGLIKVTLFRAIDMKKYQKSFQFILDISPLDFLVVFFVNSYIYIIRQNQEKCDKNPAF